MKSKPAAQVRNLEDLPNIGRSIANDLRGLGIANPEALSRCQPMEVYNSLAGPMGKRHDPCVFYTLLAVDHLFKTAEALPWWNFTDEGKRILARNR